MLIEAAGYREVRRRITIAGGQQVTLEPQLERLSISARDAALRSPQPKAALPERSTPGLLERWWFWTALGVAPIADLETRGV